jgi:Protein of unknown function (DUF2635)
MKLIAATGLKVPREDNPRTYITDEQAVDVQMSGYYVRRIADGDLIDVEDAAAPAAAEPAATKTKAKA